MPRRVMVSVASRLLPVNGIVAVMVAATGDAVSLVATVNVCDDSPAGTVMRAGTIAAGLLLASVTSIPPSGAGADNVSVAATVDPPIAELADSARLWIVNLPMVSVAVRVTSA